MEDKKIVSLYLDLQEQAIDETRSKYGPYCRHIALNILSDEQDALDGRAALSDTGFND